MILCRKTAVESSGRFLTQGDLSANLEGQETKLANQKSPPGQHHNSNPQGARRRSREMALQLLFQTEFMRESDVEEVLVRFQEDFDIHHDVAEYGADLYRGICANLSAIDSLIQTHSSHWKISRMGLVDLSVMRIAAFEMKLSTTPVPPSVAINEAVEIAKLYGSTESGAFVNGILDQVAR
jgi:N utilization substance protein B